MPHGPAALHPAAVRASPLNATPKRIEPAVAVLYTVGSVMVVGEAEEGEMREEDGYEEEREEHPEGDVVYARRGLGRLTFMLL